MLGRWYLRMRIDFVTDPVISDLCGASLSLSRMSDELAKRGHQVHVLNQFDERFFRSRWSRKRPDLVYLSTEQLDSVSVVKEATNLNIPLVIDFRTTIHSMMKRGAGMEYLYKVRKLSHKTALSLVPTQEARDFLLHLGFTRVEVLNRGVDRALFSPVRRDDTLRLSWGARQETVVFGIVGRLESDRNLYMALQHYKRLRMTYGEQIKLIVVGDGCLREMIASEFPDVILAGVRRDRDLATYYASMDVLLCPAETDCFSNVFREGMSSGLVTIAFDRFTSVFDLQSSIHSLRVPIGQEESFYKAMEYAVTTINMTRLESPMRIAARRVTRPMSWDHVSDDLNMLLQQCILFPENQGTGLASEDAVYACKTLFLSDIHLGTRDCKARECRHFIKHVRANKIVLIGDIIDAWALARGGAWRKKDGRLVRQFLKKMEVEGVELIYLRGNHDDILEHFLPLSIGNLRMQKDYMHTGIDGSRYLCIHGDGFDGVCTHYKWLAVMGSLGYDVLLWMNRFYNQYRRWRGLSYYSVSNAIKAKVKSAVNFIGNYEQQLQRMARSRKCQGIIAGHIHQKADKEIGEIRYLNCGDWVESLSAVIEENDGTFRTVTYDELMRGLVVGDYGKEGVLR